MYRIVWICAAVQLCLVSAMEKTSVYMKRSETSDQSMIGSGYKRDVDQKPQEYSFELVDTDHAIKILKDLGYDPFAPESESQADESIPVPYKQYANDYGPVTFFNEDKYYKIPTSLKVQPKKPRKSGVHPHDLHLLYPYAVDHHQKDFVHKGGKIYDEFGASKKGEKLDRGYKTLDAFTKGSKGKYNNHNTKSSYDQTGGHKQGFFSKGGNYAANQADGKQNLGASFSQKNGHDKGSKTSGYHKLIHKDDYKKQHKFYDKADKRGHFKKFGDFDAKHDNVGGRYAKGGHQNRAHENEKHKAKDISDKGKFEEIAKAFRKAEGDEGFYKKYAGFSDKGGQKSDQIGGFVV